MTQSKYLIEGRLQQILAAIQCMGAYRSYRMTPGDWAQIIGYSDRPTDWEAVFRDHPELFRESPSKRGQFALVYRRALLRLEDDGRPPLHDTQINALIDLALRLHAVANGVDLHQHTIDRSPVGQGHLGSQPEYPAFICHDSRDNAAIAVPLALEMQRIGCPVRSDEFSLTIGDSLCDSIEKGLGHCRKCILVITPNLLGEGGWAKHEYDKIFSRELVEEKRLILQVWHKVTNADVRAYSPLLADAVPFRWSLGIEYLAAKLKALIHGP